MKRILAAAAAAALVFTGCEKSSPSTEDTSAQEGSRLGESERSMSGMAAKATGNAVVADGGTALEGATAAPPDAGTVADGGTALEGATAAPPDAGTITDGGTLR